MKTFMALLKLQLISRYADLRPRNWKTQDKKSRNRMIGMTILYVFLLLYLGGVLFYLENRAIDILMTMGNPPVGMADLLVIAAVSLAMISTLILSFFFILSSLYLGRDSVFLAALPIRPRMLLSARLAQVWLSETMISAVFILPACILYGVKTGQAPLFYVRILPVWLCSAMMPIAVGSVVATLLTRATALLRHREAILTIGGMALMVGYMFLSMNLGNIMGDDETGDVIAKLFTGNETLIRGFTSLFPPAAWGINGLLGNWGQLLLFMAVSLGSIGLIIWLLGYRYRELSLLQAEAPTAVGKKGIQKGAFARSGNALQALVRREFLQILRVPSYATNIFPVCFMPLLMTVMILFITGKRMGDHGEDLVQLMKQMDLTIVMPILTGLLCFAADMNPALSTAVTREGRGHDYMKVLPVSVKTHMVAKLTVGYGLSLIGILATGIVLMVVFPVLLKEVALALVLAVLFSFGCACLALARDVKKPRLDWVTEQEAVKQSMGVMISLLLGWALLGVLGLITWLLIDKAHLTLWPLFGVLAVLMGAFAFGSWKHLMNNAEKYYGQN